ncbi:hypothetical protein F511_03516 [Dorcoceras hygrometricum]|uniref:Uncharacterized protein n=1 Tax=Dorcoceras hygrometricum TaxID=472368 RepID=A0A2Z7AA69_9LAMI|nr:hypothetical protein F511_03516 [Dorcoceras hygrometricum]
MDSSKVHQETEECSSNESGWTMYIASPDQELDYDDYEDEEEYIIGEQTYTKDPDKHTEEVDSDDSMASDASSGPSYQGILYERVDRIHGSGHAANETGSKLVDYKKHQQPERKKLDEQKKEAKDKNGNKKRNAATSKNK